VLPDAEVAYEWDGHPAGTASANCDASLKRFALLGRDGTVLLQRLTGGGIEEVARFPAAPSGSASHVWLGPDGAFVVVHRAAPAGGRAELGVWRVDWGRKGVSPRPAIPDGHHFFRPDGQRLAVLGRSPPSVGLFDLETGRRCWQVALPVAAEWLAFRPDGGALAVDQGGAIALLDAVTGREGGRLRPENQNVAKIASLAWHPAGRRLVAACGDLHIHVWDTRTGREAMTPWGGQFDWGIQIAFNHAGDRLLSYDWSRQTRLWDANTGRQLLTLPETVSPQFSADDTLLGPQRLGDKLRLWRLVPGREFRELRPRAVEGRRRLSHPVLHADGRVLAAASADGLYYFFDLESGAELASARVGPPAFRACRCFIPGGWVTSATDGALFWPARRASSAPDVLRVGPPKVLSRAGQDGASASPDGKVLLLANGDGAVLLLRDGGGPRRIDLRPQRDVRVTAVSPNKRWAATCSWGADPVSSVQLWDARTGRLEHRLPLHDGGYWAWFSPDSRWLVTTSFGQECRLWEADTWREVRRYSETCPAFSPDGRVMALGDVPGQVRLLEPATGREVGRLTGPEPIWYDPACFTSDGARLIAVARDSRAVYAWDLRAIREQLRGLGLDWGLPPLPLAAPGPPLRVEVDRGYLAHPGDFPDARAAVALFTLALALQPANPEAHLQRGRAFGRLGQRREAVADYSAFLALTPPAEPRRAEVLYRRSNNYDRLQNAAASLRDLLEMAALNLDELPLPEQAAGRCNDVAWELVKGPVQGRPAEQALVLARAAVALRPDSGWYGNTLGVALYRLGRWREAADVLGRNVGKLPELAAADFYFLAMSFQRLGDTAKARDWYDRAVSWCEAQGKSLNAAWRAELEGFRAEANALDLSARK
jgi:WD40 repeat protein